MGWVYWLVSTLGVIFLAWNILLTVIAVQEDHPFWLAAAHAFYVCALVVSVAAVIAEGIQE